MRNMDTHAGFDAPFLLEALMKQLNLTRSLRVGQDPRREARRAGPEVSYGLPHRGERRGWPQ